MPALTGLGAPHWDPHARGTILGLTRGTTRAHLVRATLEAIAFEVRDVLETMPVDDPDIPLRVDGGASANDLLCQIQADQLGVPVERPRVVETTGLGRGVPGRPRRRGVGVDRRPARDLAAGPRASSPPPTASPPTPPTPAGREAVERAKGWAES